VSSCSRHSAGRCYKPRGGGERLAREYAYSYAVQSGWQKHGGDSGEKACCYESKERSRLVNTQRYFRGSCCRENSSEIGKGVRNRAPPALKGGKSFREASFLLVYWVAGCTSKVKKIVAELNRERNNTTKKLESKPGRNCWCWKRPGNWRTDVNRKTPKISSSEDLRKIIIWGGL